VSCGSRTMSLQYLTGEKHSGVSRGGTFNGPQESGNGVCPSQLWARRSNTISSTAKYHTHLLGKGVHHSGTVWGRKQDSESRTISTRGRLIKSSNSPKTYSKRGVAKWKIRQKQDALALRNMASGETPSSCRKRTTTFMTGSKRRWESQSWALKGQGKKFAARDKN